MYIWTYLINVSKSNGKNICAREATMYKILSRWSQAIPKRFSNITHSYFLYGNYEHTELKTIIPKIEYKRDQRNIYTQRIRKYRVEFFTCIKILKSMVFFSSVKSTQHNTTQHKTSHTSTITSHTNMCFCVWISVYSTQYIQNYIWFYVHKMLLLLLVDVAADLVWCYTPLIILVCCFCWFSYLHINMNKYELQTQPAIIQSWINQPRNCERNTSKIILESIQFWQDNSLCYAILFK